MKIAALQFLQWRVFLKELVKISSGVQIYRSSCYSFNYEYISVMNIKSGRDDMGVICTGKQRHQLSSSVNQCFTIVWRCHVTPSGTMHMCTGIKCGTVAQIKSICEYCTTEMAKHCSLGCTDRLRNSLSGTYTFISLTQYK